LLGNFSKCVDFTLLPGQDGQPFHTTAGDQGGATAWGITRATLSRWMLAPASVDDVRALKVERARAIYQGFYWNTINGDGLPYGIDLMVFDHGVLAGEVQSAMDLQQALGMTGTDVDGHVGPVTLSRAKDKDPVDLITAIWVRQKAHYRSCSTFKLFGTGWLARLERRTVAAKAMLSPVVS
jgi:lysozyme family protein